LLKTGKPIDPSRKYVVAGWASVNEGTKGPAVYDLMETYIKKQGVIDLPKNESVKVIGM
jgi:sulfur-oxidizing protein SoxB